MSTLAENVDVVVVGGGPGGSTVSTLLAQRGHRVVLLEKEKFPRYQIGESLLPSTVHGIGRLLGVTEELEKAAFTVKRGGSFRWGTNPVPWNFLFAVAPELSGPTSYAYQVERMKFDDILLRNAAAKGVDVREESQVTEVIADDERVRGIRYTDSEGVPHEIRASFVVDASGNRSRIHQNVRGERIYSDFFKNIAIFGYFEGGQRLPAPDSGNILCAAFDEGWIWYIPLSDTLTSVGAVISREHAAKLQGDQEQSLRGFIDRCEIVKGFLSGATRVTEGTYGEIRTRKDYSYTNSSFHRPGMVLVGDAACFIDPVFSTGVHLSTYAGLLAARSINSVLAGDISEDRAFEEFEGRYRREYRVFYEFLSAFYDMQSNEDSYFWKARKVTNLEATDLEAFATLVGGVHSGEQAFTNAGALVEEFQKSSAGLADAVERTGSMQTESGERMHHLFGTPVVREVMTEMNNIQVRGVRGADAFEAPLLEAGLVPSPDGLSWTEEAK
ncbi:tryptophan 7-halogenase [Paractinoplanes atraurantiacus]|uniref:Halogenation protein CepH n=1 Tax=Paractinoplanes atraurantiacus TaxID=1036182 RepID=A0A285KQK2_9ACTN|nr:tryptophan 7-halogenase [Actinoplanes atraurantiacus]SNY74919.1 halogenation protein CepH [Actinoplanes atraurantiacus]